MKGHTEDIRWHGVCVCVCVCVNRLPLVTSLLTHCCPLVVCLGNSLVREARDLVLFRFYIWGHTPVCQHLGGRSRMIRKSRFSDTL